jgi:site-specific recombinase XerD
MTSLIDEFIDALWLADGLSKNTLASLSQRPCAVCRLAGGKGNNWVDSRR